NNIEERTAGYIMTEINIGSNIMLEPGVRYEFMHTDYTSNYVVENAFATDGLEAGYPIAINVDDRDNEHFFPSINSKFQVNDWIVVRAAYYKSASRPDYRLLSPGLISDNLRDNITAYNPYLRPAIAHNYDIGVTLYDNEIGFFTVNGFYKEITDLIYRLPRYQPSRFEVVTGAPDALIESLEKPRELYPGDLYTNVTEMSNFPINNPNKAFFSGFEINWQTNLWYLPGLLNGLVLDLNYTWIKSETKFPYLLIEQVGVSPGFPPVPIYEVSYQTKDSRMLDQPKHIFNARIGWDYKGFSSRLSFRYQGETVRSLDPVLNIQDSFIEDELRIDFTAKQKITENLSFIIDLSNISEVIEDAKLEKNSLIQSSEFYGFTSQFGVRYEL
ncbi:MAG: TonB-dependent receptor, partial [Melioribacteraceae bacterium]|nr:TonB-dependent receptor [Melioribacteraceae bacterium]